MQVDTAAATTSTTALRCDGCGALLAVEIGLRTAQCPYCASPAVVERPAGTAPEPSFGLGFVIPQARAHELTRKWIRRAWLSPAKFRRADVTQTRGVYLPAYLYSAASHVQYTAEIGENYTETETYTTTDAKGNTVTRTRTVIKTEWRTLSGQWASWIDEVVVTASKGLPNHVLEAVEPFDLRALRRFTPKLLSGWIAEDPSLDPTSCQAQARQEAVDKIAGLLGAHMPGDSYRDLRYTSQLSHENLELVLLPVWVLAIKYDPAEPPVRVVINGQTANLTGRRPLSWVKIVAIVMFVIAVIALAVLLGGAR